MAKRQTSSQREAYGRAKARARARSAAATAAGQEIAPLPPRKDPVRWALSRLNFKVFCETYFPHLFGWAWAADHLRVIAKIERAVLHNATFAVAMPRGSGKTTLCMIAVIWALLTGAHRFIYLVASTDEAAEDMLRLIKEHLAGNDRLAEDFPEAIYPIRRLEGETRRCAGQRYLGNQTKIRWDSDEIVMPAVPGSPCSGSMIRAAGLLGKIRGALHVLPDGTQVRPTLAICDDPQTDQSAASPLQTGRRLKVINGAVRGLAGPGEQMGVIVPCTVVFPGDLADRLLDREKNPWWQGERTKMLYQFPTDEKLWSEYAEILADSLRNDGDGSEATEFYRLRREAMDAGAVVAWPDRYTRGEELSAVQCAMNLKIKDEFSFFAEYQNEPIADALGDELLTAEQLAGKLNGYAREAIPEGCNHLTMFVDVQQKALFWLIAAWEEDFTGYVVDYGAWPDQKRTHFTLRDLRRTIQQEKPGAGLEGQLYHAMEQLAAEKLDRVYRRDDGAELRIDRCLIDANWGQSTDVVYQFCRQSAHAGVLLPSHGRYVGASSVPFGEYRRKRGDRMGLHWRIPSLQASRRAVRYVVIDTNYWKSFVQARLGVAMGDGGCLSLFGRSEKRHETLIEHLTAEYKVRTEARDRVVDEWKEKPDKPDNHWFDCLVGCAVAASIQGAQLKDVIHDSAARNRKRYTQQDLLRSYA